MGLQLSLTEDLEEDSKDIKDLFAAAKFGKWEEVWRIIGTPNQPKKHYLINLIPEDRRWAILQQAVYWNNLSVIRKLLQFSACDTSLRVKDGETDKGYTRGMTAEQIAELFGYSEASKILKNHVSVQFDEDLETFYKDNIFLDGKHALFRLTIAAYKKAFYPGKIPPMTQMKDLLNNIFRHINKDQNWVVVRDRIAQSLFSVCREASEGVGASKSRTEFFKTIGNVYTEESTQLYTYMNTALRRQRDFKYNPTADDLALGPYILMYHLILFCWKDLKHFSMTTYRKMKLSPTDLQKYQQGTQFTWLSFVSSSAAEDKAQVFPSCAPSGNIEVLFVIDNSTSSQWQPLDIEKYACYTEEERVYPAGAKFIITNRKSSGSKTTLNLRLLPG